MHVWSRIAVIAEKFIEAKLKSFKLNTYISLPNYYNTHARNNCSTLTLAWSRPALMFTAIILKYFYCIAAIMYMSLRCLVDLQYAYKDYFSENKQANRPTNCQHVYHKILLMSCFRLTQRRPVQSFYYDNYRES